ncbi:MAG: PqqD family protein [Dermatophilaceae bacterium]
MTATIPSRPATAESPVLRFPPLTFVDEPTGVMVGRVDTNSYAVLPPEGVAVLRRLQAGSSLTDAVAWFAAEYGAPLDIDDFVETLRELGFVLGADEPMPAPPRLRFAWLGRLLFSPAAWALYVGVVAAGLAAMVRDPSLRPGYQQIFFTTHLSVVTIVLAAAQLPLVVLHELSHALAGWRLGLPSRFSIGRRYIYLVAETQLDALHSVPRRRRYLPFIAGLLIDMVGLAGLTLAAAALRNAGVPQWWWRLCLALAFVQFGRIVWQFLFYLRTDLYYVAATAAGCTDLDAAARDLIRRRVGRLFLERWRRPGADFSDRDRRAARWYAPLLVSGYGVTTVMVLWAGIPAVIQMWTLTMSRFQPGANAPVGDLIDSITFIAVNLAQVWLLLHLIHRDRRTRAAETKGT